ncbi:MAG TPA: hypothetical protein VN722_08385 [Hanamia sp.]|nr:hypothetical protein [Hanamia sp.]
MITANGYSKDPNIIPEGIVITFGKEMMQEQGGAKLFLTTFIESMNTHEEGAYWMHKCSNLPAMEVDIVYIIVLNRLWAKVYSGGYKRNPKDVFGYSADGVEKIIDWNHIVLSGPILKCSFKRALKGFQGFRYCTKLF